MIQLGGSVHPLRGIDPQLLDPGDGFVGLGGLLHALIELADLHVHRPDHLVHAIGLHDRMLDRMLLVFERLRPL